MEMVGPYASVGSNTIWTKWYPGIEWRVPIKIKFGQWPFRYELVSGPSGMEFVNSTLPTLWTPNGLRDFGYGELRWTNPTSGTHSITVRVYDQAHGRPSDSYVERTWNLVVSTSNWVFVDATNGSNSNAGTLAAPFQTMSAWYGATQATTTYDGYAVMYRAGTYRTDVLPLNGSETDRATLRSHKAHLHVAYPGEAVTWDTRGRYMMWEGSPDVYIGGINHVGLNQAGSFKSMAFANSTNATVFRCTFGSQIIGGSTGGTNPAHIFVIENGNSSNLGIMRCAFTDITDIHGVEAYTCTGGIIEGNTITGVTGGNGRVFYLKSLNSEITIRANHGLSGCRRPLVMVDTYNVQNYIDITHNSYVVQSSDIYLHLANEIGGALGIIRVGRNSFAGGHILNRGMSGGTITYVRNVHEHDGLFANAFENTDGANTSSWTVTDDTKATSGLLDASNLLESSQSSILGIRGHEVA